MEMTERLEQLYLSGEVKRLHTVPVLQGQTVAEHVYGSMLIGVELCRMNPQANRFHVMEELLYHDAPEATTGDTPAPIKRDSRALREALKDIEYNFYEEIGIATGGLSRLEADIVKAADTLDLMFKCVRERRMGNRTVRIERVMENVVKYIEEQAHVIGVPEVCGYLVREWNSGRSER